MCFPFSLFFFFQAEDGIRDYKVTGVQTCALPIYSVLAEARQMADRGYTEIQLLGQNVNSYKDPEGKKSFAELLAAVGEVPGIRRVRFTTSHPRDFGRDIIDAIDSVPTLCDHVHLPVQSGSSRADRKSVVEGKR